MSDGLELVDRPSYPSERRQHSRQQVRSIAYVELDEGNGGIVLNVSEGGLSVQAVVSLMDEQLPRMRIQLSQPQDWVETGARIAWTGKSRKVVGLQFVDLPEQARSQIREWVSRETLPASLPHESNARRGEEEHPPRTRVASQAAVPLAEPVAPRPAGDDHAQNVSPEAEAVVVPPTTPAQEPAPPMNLAIMPAPTPARTSPPTPLPAPILNAAPGPASPPADQVIGRAFDHTHYTELKLTGRPPKAASHAPRQVARHGTLAALTAFLALMSLGAGWAAGRGAFDGVFAKVHAMTSRRSAADRDVNSPTRPILAVSGVEAADVNSVRSAVPVNVPINAPTPAPVQNPRRKAPANLAPQPSRKPVTLEAQNLSPTIRRQAAGYTNGPGEGAPPVSDLQGGSDNILPAAGSMDFRDSIPAPPVERQPAVLKRGELVHRVDPIYPTVAREQRIQGTVTLRISIAADGTVHNIEVVSGSPLLTGAAVDAVRQWRYRPTLLNGKPVQADNEISLVFRLSNSSQ